ncbi:MAG: hypothetical protein ABI856_13415 [Nitrospira sp.]
MAAVMERHPRARVHLTINLSSVILWHLEDYAERGATDGARELITMPARRLTAADREVAQHVLRGELAHADLSVPRYRELFEQRRKEDSFMTHDLTDLQMCFNLAWSARSFKRMRWCCRMAISLPYAVSSKRG